MLYWSLLFFRNICLDRSRKPVLLSRKTWIEFFIEQCISGQQVENVHHAAYAALWGLLHQSQKAVSILKKHPKLDQILARATQEGASKVHRAVQILIQN